MRLKVEHDLELTPEQAKMRKWWKRRWRRLGRRADLVCARTTLKPFKSYSAETRKGTEFTCRNARACDTAAQLVALQSYNVNTWSEEHCIRIHTEYVHQRVGDTSDVMYHHVSLYRLSLYRAVSHCICSNNGASGGTGKYTSNIRCIERYINPLIGN
jgi:hypothetical protein